MTPLDRILDDFDEKHRASKTTADSSPSSDVVDLERYVMRHIVCPVLLEAHDALKQRNHSARITEQNRQKGPSVGLALMPRSAKNSGAADSEITFTGESGRILCHARVVDSSQHKWQGADPRDEGTAYHPSQVTDEFVWKQVTKFVQDVFNRVA